MQSAKHSNNKLLEQMYESVDIYQKTKYANRAKNVCSNIYQKGQQGEMYLSQRHIDLVLSIRNQD